MIAEVRFFEEMIGQRISPDAVAYCSLINGFCRLGKFTKAVRYSDQVVCEGISPDEYIYNSLIHGFPDCLADAEDLFKSMEDKARKIKTAKKLFDQMQLSGLSPSVSVYTVLLDGLCKIGHSEEALELYSSAERNRLQPSIEFFSILVDGMRRAGRLEEKDDTDKAIRLLKDMHNRNLMPNKAVTWMILQLMQSSNTMAASQTTMAETAAASSGVDKASVPKLLQLHGLDHPGMIIISACLKVSVEKQHEVHMEFNDTVESPTTHVKSNFRKKDRRKGHMDKRAQYCNHCSKPAHTRDTCFKIHGTPHWCKEMIEQKRRDSRQVRGNTFAARS
ncbi:UNVERIFIED_CONTAM: hypothetical protein Sradi_7137100 [Sesamum radiatum]|uniref:Pentatricopeptide repeat-containing protein n=1 Tax=Sesamum radiatum TaxID=300843 RepID=A0AAW2IWY8_SESRA